MFLKIILKTNEIDKFKEKEGKRVCKREIPSLIQKKKALITL